MTVEPVPDPQPRQHAPGRGAVPKPRLRGKSRHDVAAPPGGFTKILVTDFNQTIARDGRVDGATVAALRWLRDEAGFALILATGETMYHLKGGAGFIAFPELGDIFHAVICDNGGAVGNPATGKSRRLGKKPPPAFLRRLDIVASPGNLPYYTGKTSVSLHREHHDTAASVIAELQLPLVAHFDGAWVTYLPPGIDKLSAIQWLIKRWGATMGDVIGVGNGENDARWLAHAGRAAAVVNAEPAVKEVATIQLVGAAGAGVVELVNLIRNGKLPPVRAGVAPPARGSLGEVGL